MANRSANDANAQWGRRVTCNVRRAASGQKQTTNSAKPRKSYHQPEGWAIPITRGVPLWPLHCSGNCCCMSSQNVNVTVSSNLRILNTVFDFSNIRFIEWLVWSNVKLDENSGWEERHSWRWNTQEVPKTTERNPSKLVSLSSCSEHSSSPGRVFLHFACCLFCPKYSLESHNIQQSTCLFFN